MGRFAFAHGKQKQWLDDVLAKSKLTIDEIAKLCNFSPRTIRDWRREKFTINKDSCLLLSKKYGIDIPQDVKELDDYWYGIKGARRGGVKYYALYGAPGTTETRRIGGFMSQARRRENPEKYRLLGCNVPNTYLPIKPSNMLAEMMGIILGDGGITKNQLTITLDSESDKEYIFYVQTILRQLFQHEPSRHKRKTQRAVDLRLSGIDLIKLLMKWGLKSGNKIKMQVDFPRWIWEKHQYQKMCVRGLMDTDGCVYIHHHSVNGNKYKNIGLCFSNHSVPLLKSVSKVLRLNNIKNTLRINSGGVWVYSTDGVKKYLKIFGSSNPKFTDKLEHYLLYNQG